MDKHCYNYNKQCETNNHYEKDTNVWIIELPKTRMRLSSPWKRTTLHLSAHEGDNAKLGGIV